MFERHSEVVWGGGCKRWAGKAGKIEIEDEPKAVGAGQQRQKEGDDLL